MRHLDIARSRNWTLPVLAAFILLAVPAAVTAQTNDHESTPGWTGAGVPPDTGARGPGFIKKGELKPVFLKESEQLRERLRGEIDGAVQLREQERARMRENLDTCLQLGLDPSDAEALFAVPEDAPRTRLEAQLRHQNRVRQMLEEGLPPGPVVTKLQEGRLKGVPEPRLEQALMRMEENVRAAHRVLQRAQQDGLPAPADPAQRRTMTRELARSMWDGLTEGDVDQLRERARDRLRDGSCDLEDLTTAAETATRLQHEGIERERAVRLVGEALQQGYTHQEMNELSRLVMAGRGNGVAMDAMADGLQSWIGNGLGNQEMMRNMLQQGWLGPGDIQGPGGQHPNDSLGGGPGEQTGNDGSMGPGSSGGMGGDPGGAGGGSSDDGGAGHGSHGGGRS